MSERERERERVHCLSCRVSGSHGTARQRNANGRAASWADSGLRYKLTQKGGLGGGGWGNIYSYVCGQCAQVRILKFSIISTNLTDLGTNFKYFYKSNYCSSIYLYIKIYFQSEHNSYAVCTALFSITCNSLFSSHTAKFRM